MRSTRSVATLVSALLIASCATPSQYRPIVDTKGVEMSHYEEDLRECQQYAYQVDVANNTAASAAAGAVVLGALAAVFGNRYDVGRFAAAGAITGGVNGAAAGAQTQVDIIRNCMQGRGYRVLARVPDVRPRYTQRQMSAVDFSASSIGRPPTEKNI